MPNWTQEHSTFEEIFENFKKFQDPVAPKVSDIALLIYPLTFLHDLVTKAIFTEKATAHLFQAFLSFFSILLTLRSSS